MTYVDIYQILDMLNKEVNYIGLDNTGKKTDDRDDVVKRQAVSNWINEYNRLHERKIMSYPIDQYRNKYFKSDIEKLIKHFKKRLYKTYTSANKTILLKSGIRISTELNNSIIKEELQSIESEIDLIYKKIIEGIIKKDHLFSDVYSFVHGNKAIDVVDEKKWYDYIELSKIPTDILKDELEFRKEIDEFNEVKESRSIEASNYYED